MNMHEIFTSVYLSTSLQAIHCVLLVTTNNSIKVLITRTFHKYTWQTNFMKTNVNKLSTKPRI